jgi:hypothetical protein
MKFNPKPGNSKKEKKAENLLRKDHSNNIRSAEYQAMQEKIETPFGKAFKTGAQIDKKKQVQKGEQKHKGKGWE